MPSSHSIWGQPIPPLGTLVKAAPMAMLAGGKRIPKFNKMSGIAEFNNAVVLFVNVNAEYGRYDNSFTVINTSTEESNSLLAAPSSSAAPSTSASAAAASSASSEEFASTTVLTMTWFAQQRQTEDTPVIQRMLPDPEARRPARSRHPLLSSGQGPLHILWSATLSLTRCCYHADALHMAAVRLARTSSQCTCKQLSASDVVVPFPKQNHKKKKRKKIQFVETGIHFSLPAKPLKP